MSKDIAAVIHRMRIDKASKASFCKCREFFHYLSLMFVRFCLVNTFGRKKTLKFKSGGSDSLLSLQNRMESQG
jgi:hypothetical protein